MIAAAAYWQDARALPIGGLHDVAPGRALVLAPHPDDESLGCGGLIAEACSQGNPPLVVVLTDGAQSHPGSRKYPAERLRAVREAEAIAAVGQLGLPGGCVMFMRYPDTAAPAEGSALQEAVGQIASLLQEFGCSTILAPWRHDPHCDHEAAHRIARRVALATGAMHRAYPVWGLTLPPDHLLDGPPRGLRLDVERHRPAKQRAIRAHASQYAGLIDDDPDGFQMQPGFMALFDVPFELFLDPA